MASAKKLTNNSTKFTKYFKVTFKILFKAICFVELFM